MRQSTEERKFMLILISAAVAVIASAAVCVTVFVKSGKSLNAFSSKTEAVGEFVGYVTPSEDKIYSPGDTVLLSVSAKNGASAYAMISGEKISLNVTEEKKDGYSVFSGSVIMPQATDYEQELGNAAFFVTYGGITQICYGGRITVTAAAKSNLVISSENEAQGEKNAKLLTVTGMMTEGKDVTTNELFFNPQYGNLVCGMTDYVTGKIIDYDDDGNEAQYYKLLSGRAVKADSNVTLTDAGSVMTYNTASLSSSGGKIIMNETMKVPYKLRYVGQSFTKGYETLAYNAKPFTATAIDFIFEYTTSFSGSLSSYSDEVISGVDVFTNADDKTLILHCRLKRAGKFFGYIMEYDEKGSLCISFRKPVKSLSQMSIIIDPGHGKNPGALDFTGKHGEAQQVLRISKHLAAYLSSAGAKVYMTRTADTEVSLETRRLMNQQIKPDLFISIHLNGAENTSRSGTSTYYFTPFSQPLAECINKRLAEIYTESCYKNNPEMSRKANGGDRYYPFFVTRTDVCPSVLVEVGFFTNELESKYLLDEAYQQAFGRAIFNAVSDFAQMS